MTDQSRVKVVARAIDEIWEHNFMRAEDSYIPEDFLSELAQAAIEANDAWLKGRVDIAADRIKDRWMHVQPRESLTWQQVAETTVEALLWEPNQ